jgi:hypothetical protein
MTTPIHLLRHYIHTCIIQRGSLSYASFTGEPTRTYSNLGSFSCRYVEDQERIADEGAGLQMLEEPFLMLPSGTDIQEEDRITNIVFTRGSASVESGPLTVEELYKRNSTTSHHIYVKLERIE